MKVLVHLNHRSGKSYLLAFGKNMSPKKLKTILGDPNQTRAIQKLMLYSAGLIEICPRDKCKVQASANFTISQHGYLLERLA